MADQNDVRLLTAMLCPQRLDVGRQLERAFYRRGSPTLKYAGEFDPSEHPHDDLGRWARKDLESHHASMVDKALSAIEFENPKIGAAYRRSMKKVLSALSDESLSRLKRNISSYHFYRSPDEVQDEFERRTGKRPKNMDGFFSHKGGEVHVNGGHEAGASPWGEPAALVYAHEIGHALDRDHQITDDNEWRDIWADELHGVAGGRSSVSPAEGFATFAEIVLLDRQHAETFYPRATRFWKDKGIID